MPSTTPKPPTADIVAAAASLGLSILVLVFMCIAIWHRDWQQATFWLLMNIGENVNRKLTTIAAKPTLNVS